MDQEEFTLGKLKLLIHFYCTSDAYVVEEGSGSFFYLFEDRRAKDRKLIAEGAASLYPELEGLPLDLIINIIENMEK